MAPGLWHLHAALIESPDCSRIGSKEDCKQQYQRQRVQPRAEVPPYWRAVPYIPPCRERQIQQEENAENARWTHPEPDQQRDSNQQLDYADGISEKKLRAATQVPTTLDGRNSRQCC